MYAGDEDLSNVVVWCLEPGQENSTHRHPDSAHFIVVLEGSGECLRGDEGPPDPVRTGQVLIIPRGAIHGIRNTGTERLSYVAASTAGYQREPVGEQTGRFAAGPRKKARPRAEVLNLSRKAQPRRSRLPGGGKEEGHADKGRHTRSHGYGPDPLRRRG